MPLAQLIHCLATDRPFATRMLHDRQAALARFDLKVHDEAVEVLLALLADRARWRRLCSPSQVIPEDLPWQSPQFDLPATN